LPLPKQPATTQLPFVYDTPSDTARERQSRVDRILEKYRRQPSSSNSRQFSRSVSCNTATESSTVSTESNLHLHTARIVATDEENNNKSRSSGPRSVSPYAPIVDCSDCTFTARRENKTTNNATVVDGLLSKSYSLKSLGDYRNRTSFVDYESILKSNHMSTNNNDEDPPSWSSSSSTATTTSKSAAAVPKEDANRYSPASLDWTVGNCNEETMSDRIKRRSYYVKLK